MKNKTNKEIINHIHNLTTAKVCLRAIFKEYPSISLYTILMDKKLMNKIKERLNDGN